METLASRLAHAMAMRGRKITPLAAAAGMTYQGVKKILDGKTSTIKADSLFPMAAYLKVDPTWLSTGEGSMELVGILARLQSGLPVAGFNEQSNVTPLVARAKVPLISWVQAGELQDVFDFFEPGEAVRWEDAIESKPSKHGYALLVEGDSMVSNLGGHSFPPGTVLIVDPERHATANSYVIAKDVGTQKATFKQLVTDGARWYLKALNTQYPTIEIDDPNLRVIGVVLEAKPPSVKLA